MKANILIALAVLAFSCGGVATSNGTEQGHPVGPPPDWTKVDLQHFSFYLPPTMARQNARGIDSAVWEFRNGSSRLTIDLGRHSNDLSTYGEWPDYQEQEIRIGSRKAKICTFRHAERFLDSADDNRLFIAAIFFPDIGNGNKLTLWMTSNDQIGQETAKMIFNTVTFK